MLQNTEEMQNTLMLLAEDKSSLYKTKCGRKHWQLCNLSTVQECQQRQQYNCFFQFLFGPHAGSQC